jgi:hypothetical protein
MRSLNVNKNCDLESTLFPVVEVPVPEVTLTKDAGYVFEGKSMSDYKFIVNENNGNIISCMTKDYRLVKNETVIESAIKRIEDQGGVLSEAMTTQNGRRSFWNWRFPDIEVPMAGEEMNPTIEIHNSYDGSTEIRIMGGTFRLVCTNGLMIGTVTSDKKNKHLYSNAQIDILGDLISQTIDNTLVMFGPIGEKLNDKKLKDKDIFYCAEKLFSQRTNELYIQRILLDKPKTYWDLLNVCTNVCTHHMDRNRQIVRNIEAQIFPTILKLANVQTESLVTA